MKIAFPASGSPGRPLLASTEFQKGEVAQLRSAVGELAPADCPPARLRREIRRRVAAAPELREHVATALARRLSSPADDGESAEIVSE